MSRYDMTDPALTSGIVYLTAALAFGAGVLVGMLLRDEWRERQADRMRRRLEAIRREPPARPSVGCSPKHPPSGRAGFDARPGAAGDKRA